MTARSIALLVCVAALGGCTQHPIKIPAKQPKPGAWQVIVPAEGGHVWRLDTQTGALEACTVTAGDAPKAQCIAANQPNDPLGIRTAAPSSARIISVRPATGPLRVGESVVEQTPNGPVTMTRTK